MGCGEVRWQLPDLTVEQVAGVVEQLHARGYVRFLALASAASEPVEVPSADLHEPSIWVSSESDGYALWLEQTPEGAAYYFGPDGKQHFSDSGE